MNCHEAIAELIQSIDAGTAISDTARDHLRECSRCRALLATVSEQQTPEAPAVEKTAAAAEAAVRKERTKQIAGRVIACVAALIVFGLLMIVPVRRGDISADIAVGVVFGAILLAIVIGAPVLLLFELVAHSKTQRGERRFYKRLRPGRWLEGVCLGIAEATGWSVTLVRLGFALLVWFKGLGILAYIVCALAMPVHPDDRRYLLRFKIARAWRRFRGSSDEGEFSRP